MSNKWTDDLKQLADNMQAAPPERLLEEVKQTMADRGLTPALGVPARIIRLRRIRATAASLLLLASIGTAIYMMIPDHQTGSSPIAGTTGPASRGTDAPASRQAGHEAEPLSSDMRSADGSENMPSSERRQAVRSARYGSDTGNGQEGGRHLLAEGSAVSPVQGDMDEGSTYVGRDQATPSQVTPSPRRPDSKPRKTDSKIRKEPAAQEKDIGTDNEATLYAQAEPARGAATWSISLYSGSMPNLQTGVHGDMMGSYAGQMPMNDPRNVMLLPQANSPQGLYMAEMPHDTSEKHHRPLRIGLSVSYPLSGRWSLQSGLTYSRLTSEFSETWSIGDRTTEQTLHYLGVPLNLSYDLWGNSKWNLYVSGGGMAELLVKGRKQTTTSEYSQTANPKEKLTDHRPVWSLTGTVGATYRPIPSVGLYIEPGLSWYPRQNHHPKSYYSDHPLNFQFNFGLRFTVGH